MCRLHLSLGSSFGIAEHLLFTLGVFISIFLKDLKFSLVGFIWGLGSQLSGGIYHQGLS